MALSSGSRLVTNKSLLLLKKERPLLCRVLSKRLFLGLWCPSPLLYKNELQNISIFYLKSVDRSYYFWLSVLASVLPTAYCVSLYDTVGFPWTEKGYIVLWIFINWQSCDICCEIFCKSLKINSLWRLLK